MKNIITVFVYSILVFCCNVAFSQVCKQQYLTLELSIDQQQLNLLEPIEYSIKLINHSNKNMVITEPWSAYVKPELEYRNNLDTNWVNLIYSNRANFSPIIPWETDFNIQDEIILPANDSMEKKFIWAFFINRKEQIKINNIKEFSLRVSIHPCDNKNKSTVFSNEVKVNFVLDKDNKNRMAYDFLMKKETPGFIYEPIIFGPFGWGVFSFRNKNTKKDLEELIRIFPNSRFTKWAKLQLAFFYYSGYGNPEKNIFQPDYEKVKSLLTELKDVDSEYIQKIRLILLDEVDFDPFRE